MRTTHILALLGVSAAMALGFSTTASAAVIMSCTIQGNTGTTLTPVFPALNDTSKTLPHVGDYTFDGTGTCSVPIGPTGFVTTATATLRSEGHYWTTACQSGNLYDDDASPFGRDTDGLTSTLLTLNTSPQQLQYNFAYNIATAGVTGVMTVKDFTPVGQAGSGLGHGLGGAVITAKDATGAATTCDMVPGTSFDGKLAFTVWDAP